ncbi:MAG: PAS domain-containing protein, partial [Deltaproteobacteria bacterium]|nr:PAS domain-containing protein [Deltaproteobacteria bacterium]
MTGNGPKPLHAWSIPFKIVALYVVVGILYILFSDTLLESVVKDPATLTRISIYKGMAYVLVTAALLFLLIGRYIAKIRRNQEELRESEQRYRRLSREFQALLDAIPDNLVSLSPDLKIRWVNSVASRTMEKDGSGLADHGCDGSWYGRTEPCEECAARECLRSRKPETRLVGSPRGRTYELRAVPILDENGTVVSIVEVGRDITEMKRMEERLLQSHKMEAVGRLAGGVAHDFNNLLTVITGFGDLLLSRMEKDDPRRKEAEEIRKAGDRAAALTRQLLAFSRRQVLQPEVVDLNRIVRDLGTMLGRLIGEDTGLETSLDAGLGRVKVDPGQIEQVVV